MLAARLPCTATVLAAGEIGPGHGAVVRRTMGRLDRVDTVSVGQWVFPAPRRPGRQPARPVGVERAGRALLTITMDHRWLRLAVGRATLDSGALVDAGTVRRWAGDAEIVPMVLGSRSEPLDVGRVSRTVPDAIRRALNLRDGGCAFPGCTRRPRRCHAHHVDHWVDGGPTCLANLVLLCRLHHQLIHHRHWVIKMIDGLAWFAPPVWVDPDRTPVLGDDPASPSEPVSS